MSPTRAKYITAKKAYDSACEQEKLERQADGYPQRLRMAEHFTQCMARDLETARSEYFREFREALAERDPAFKRIQSQATVACSVYYAAKTLRDELRRLVLAARRVPEFEHLDSLDPRAVYAAERIRMATDSGARAQLEACNAELETLRHAHEDYSAQAFTYLEAAIDQAEQAASAEEGRAA